MTTESLLDAPLKDASLNPRFSLGLDLGLLLGEDLDTEKRRSGLYTSPLPVLVDSQLTNGFAKQGFLRKRKAYFA
jgi:hypothetical protein